MIKEKIEFTPAEKVAIARNSKRHNIEDIIKSLFTDFFEQKGDCLSADDESICGGIALYHGIPVTVIGHKKGKNVQENIACNFGMPNPQGYRKALRLMMAAQKFNRPIITFIDTPGAYPGINAEENGQGSAIAQCLAKMSTLNVPIIAVVTGEGGSGGALALGVANTVLMLENAVYSVLSPEGFATILWKDPSRAKEACDVMKLTAKDLLELKIIDVIVPEVDGGAHTNNEKSLKILDEYLYKSFQTTCKITNIAQHRYNKYRTMGNDFIYSLDKEKL